MDCVKLYKYIYLHSFTLTQIKMNITFTLAWSVNKFQYGIYTHTQCRSKTIYTHNTCPNSMKPSRCTPPPQNFPKRPRMQPEASQFSGFHKYEQNKTKQTTFLHR